ncbi:hypothetical protein EU642_22215 [Salmonella enterica]|nr:hypothetical protein [Salmonella enterica]EAO0118570.1 hypothetical protein [Salmonella enterica]EAO3601673.1 hypothetical protein [Salmonella enterica]EAR6391568.1 hypothetical protein [Salmonella enterica]EAV1285332.1 hypothetical protein [Salmonella enterica]
MKPMLKAVFFQTVTDLLAKGFKPELTISPLTCWGNLTWNDADNKKQVVGLFSSHDCSPLTSRVSRQRFAKWFAEAVALFHEKAAEALTIGERVMWGNYCGVVTAIRVRTLREPNGTPKAQQRTGVIVLDDQKEVKAGEVRAINYLDEDDFKAMCWELFMGDGHRHMVQVIAGAVRLRWARPGTTTRTKHIDLYTSKDQKLVEGHARVLTRWFNQANTDCGEYARDQVASDQAVERRSEQWFEERNCY